MLKAILSKEVLMMKRKERDISGEINVTENEIYYEEGVVKDVR